MTDGREDRAAGGPTVGAAGRAGGARGFASRGCVVCGRENPAGLRAVFVTGPEGAVARTAVPEQLQGFAGLAHGGVVAGLLDDAMWYACYGAGAVTLTAELVTRFRRPVRVGEPVEAHGRLVEVRGRLHVARAELRDAASGELLAEARGKFLAVEEPLRGELAGTGIQEVALWPEPGAGAAGSSIQEGPAVILGGGGTAARAAQAFSDAGAGA